MPTKAHQELTCHTNIEVIGSLTSKDIDSKGFGSRISDLVMAIPGLQLSQCRLSCLFCCCGVSVEGYGLDALDPMNPRELGTASKEMPVQLEVEGGGGRDEVMIGGLALDDIDCIVSSLWWSS